MRAPEEDQPAATVDDALAALGRTPCPAVPSAFLAEIVAACSGEPVEVGEVLVPAAAVAADWFVAVSPDRLAAFLVPVDPVEVALEPSAQREAPAVSAAEPAPETGADAAAEPEPEPEPTPQPIHFADISSALTAAGVIQGVLSDVLTSFDPSRLLETIECIARGMPAVEGRSGIVRVAIADREDHAPVTRDDGTVDHHATLAARFVPAGTVIATREPAVEGLPGVDVYGQSVAPRSIVDPALEPLAGQNTALQGNSLVATNPGRPVRNGERIDLLPSYEVPGDLNYAVGSIEFEGDVTIRGDVKAGFSVLATGSVIVGGLIEHAVIRAGHDITALGVIGDHDHDNLEGAAPVPPTLEAGGDIEVQYLHAVVVQAGGEIRVNREIVNCSVRAARVTTSSRARIVGGHVTADTESPLDRSAPSAARPPSSTSTPTGRRTPSSSVPPRVCMLASGSTSAAPSSISRTICPPRPSGSLAANWFASIHSPPSRTSSLSPRRPGGTPRSTELPRSNGPRPDPTAPAYWRGVSRQCRPGKSRPECAHPR
ncbi:MAG: FapA family protein [Chloroflexi bacterium]|nr:FapA family protein [Chloroflexota bacterium]